MISVLIPFYNWDISGLIEDVLLSADLSECPVEIIGCDDHSSDPTIYDSLVEHFKGIERIRLFRNDSNLGRSATRNRLVDQASFDHLIFIDGDSRLSEPKTYIANYVRSYSGTDVVFGGTKYVSKKPSDEALRLHWNYGRKRESKNAAIRNQQSMRYIFSNNFSCSKEVLQQVRFNEDLKDYGYEDSFWGNQVLHAGYNINHIDNYVIHIGLNNNNVFLSNSDQAINTLADKIESEEANHIVLLRYYRSLSASFYGKFVLYLARNLNSIARFVLRKSLISSVLVFDFYRLGKLARTLKKLLLENR